MPYTESVLGMRVTRINPETFEVSVPKSSPMGTAASAALPTADITAKACEVMETFADVYVGEYAPQLRAAVENGDENVVRCVAFGRRACWGWSRSPDAGCGHPLLLLSQQEL